MSLTATRYTSRCVQYESVCPDHASIVPAVLASCTTANIFQTGSTGISVYEMSCPDASERQPAPCRCFSRSTTFAFCVINESFCATDTFSNSRWFSLCVAAAKTWNSLPSEVTSSVTVTLSTFEQKIKTYLFHCHFPARNISPYWCTMTAMLFTQLNNKNQKGAITLAAHHHNQRAAE